MAEKNVVLDRLSLGDLDEIIALKGKVLRNPRFDPRTERALYEWGFVRNPYRQQDKPMGFVLKRAGRIVGSVALIPAAFIVRGKPAYGCYEIDLMVAEDARFHGLSLLTEVWKKDHLPVVVSTTPNKTSFGLERMLGAKIIPYSDRKYIKIVDPYGFCRKKYGSPVLAATAGFAVTAFNFINKASNGLFARRTSAALKEEKIERFDRRFDVLSDEAAKGYAAMHSKSSQYLQWRYFDFPFGARTVYAVSDNKDTVCGYIVIQRERSEKNIIIGSILELFTRKGDTAALERLLSIAERHAGEEKLEALQMMPFSKAIASALTCAGFTPRALPMPACLFKVQGLGPADLFVSSGDGDTAVYSCIEHRS